MEILDEKNNGVLLQNMGWTGGDPGWKEQWRVITEYGMNRWRSWMKRTMACYYRIWDEQVEILDEKNIGVLLQNMGWTGGDPGWKEQWRVITEYGMNRWRSWMKRTMACYYRIRDEQVEILDEKNIWMLLLTMGLIAWKSWIKRTFWCYYRPWNYLWGSGLVITLHFFQTVLRVGLEVETDCNLRVPCTWNRVEFTCFLYLKQIVIYMFPLPVLYMHVYIHTHTHTLTHTHIHTHTHTE